MQIPHQEAAERSGPVNFSVVVESKANVYSVQIRVIE